MWSTPYARPVRSGPHAGPHWHDLCDTLVSMLGEAGLSEIQIAAITGNSVMKCEVGGYLNMSRNLAEEAYTWLNAMLLQKPTNYLQINH